MFYVPPQGAIFAIWDIWDSMGFIFAYMGYVWAYMGLYGMYMGIYLLYVLYMCVYGLYMGYICAYIGIYGLYGTIWAHQLRFQLVSNSYQLRQLALPIPIQQHSQVAPDFKGGGLTPQQSSVWTPWPLPLILLTPLYPRCPVESHARCEINAAYSSKNRLYTLMNTSTVCISNNVSEMKALWLFKRQRLEDLPASKASLSLINRVTSGGHVQHWYSPDPLSKTNTPASTLTSKLSSIVWNLWLASSSPGMVAYEIWTAEW